MTKKYFTQGQAIDFIEKAFGDGRQSNGGLNISVICPMCKAYKGQSYSKQKLVIRTDNFWNHCWVCGYKSRNLYKLLKKWSPQYVDEYKEKFLDAEELQTTEGEDKHTYQTVKLPTGFTLLANNVKLLDEMDSLVTKRYFERALDYLKFRGIKNTSELWYWKFGITEFYKEGCKDRIIIPSFDREGMLNYWTGRSWRRKPKKKYNNPNCNRKNIIFNEINIDWGEPLTIVEGPFDLLKCNQNATCLLGSELTLEYSLMQKIIKNKTPVVLAFDPNKDAQDKQFILANRFNEFDVFVRIIEYKNKEKDIGDLTKSEFMDLLELAKVYSINYELKRRISSILR